LHRCVARPKATSVGKYSKLIAGEIEQSAVIFIQHRFIERVNEVSSLLGARRTPMPTEDPLSRKLRIEMRQQYLTDRLTQFLRIPAVRCPMRIECREHSGRCCLDQSPRPAGIDLCAEIGGRLHESACRTRFGRGCLHQRRQQRQRNEYSSDFPCCLLHQSDSTVGTEDCSASSV
jgi:hypothetical protein